MHFFEQELRNVMAESSVLIDQKYVGRGCYGTLDVDIRAKIEFVTLGNSNRYEGVRTSIINRKDGVVDSLILCFADIWGRRKVDNPNFREGIVPYIWTDRENSQWYVFKPQVQDYRQLSAGIDRYLSVFQDMKIVKKQQEGLDVYI